MPTITRCKNSNALIFTPTPEERRTSEVINNQKVLMEQNAELMKRLAKLEKAVSKKEE